LSLPLAQFDVSLGAVKKSALLETRPDGSEAGPGTHRLELVIRNISTND